MASFPFVWCRVGGADEADGAANVDGVVPVTARYSRNAVLSAGIGDGNLGNTSGNPLLPNWIGHFWGPGANIKVGFIGGSLWQQRQVKDIAPQWAEYGNFTISFPEEAAFDIQVDFVPALANFSMIGAHSLWCTERSVASMNLGSVQYDTPEKLRRAVILQVFGLALGLTHTYPDKIADIPWNKAEVYKDLGKGPLGWSQDDVDKRAFVAENYAMPHYFGDSKSIMQYAYPSNWVKKTSSWSPWGAKPAATFDWNLEITQQDKELVHFYYPDTITARNDAKHFQSMEIRHWNAPAGVTMKQEPMVEPWAAPHRFLYGLTLFDLDNEKNFRLKCSVAAADDQNLTAMMESTGDSINYLSGMSFLELKSWQYYAQTGTFNTTDVHSADKPQMTNSKRIDFKQTFFGNAPKVITWIIGVNQDRSSNIRVKTYATNVDTKGFTINMDAWGDSVFYQGEAGWLAIPAYQSDATVGSVNTMDVRPWQNPIPDTSGSTKWNVSFWAPPKVFFALNWLDMSNEGTWCCRSAFENVTKDGFKWNFQSWWTTKLYSAGASYFAWQS